MAVTGGGVGERLMTGADAAGTAGADGGVGDDAATGLGSGAGPDAPGGGVDVTIFLAPNFGGRFCAGLPSVESDILFPTLSHLSSRHTVSPLQSAGQHFPEAAIIGRRSRKCKEDSVASNSSGAARKHLRLFRLRAECLSGHTTAISFSFSARMPPSVEV